MNDPTEKNVERREISISFTDITEFLTAAGVDGNCPACKNTSWSVVHGKENSGVKRYPAISLASSERGIFDGFYLPVIFCVCKRCAFMRPHSLSAILDWIDGGKKEIEKNG